MQPVASTLVFLPAADPWLKPVGGQHGSWLVHTNFAVWSKGQVVIDLGPVPPLPSAARNSDCALYREAEQGQLADDSDTRCCMGSAAAAAAAAAADIGSPESHMQTGQLTELVLGLARPAQLSAYSQLRPAAAVELQVLETWRKMAI